jgi:hypothetical protein
MKQHTLYEPTMTWLEDKGFRVLVTGARRNFVVAVSDLFDGPYKVPDLVGVDKSNRVVIAEVEKDKNNFFDALGRCMLWRYMATFVYLVYPKGKIARAPFLGKVGVGLLEVDENSGAVTELVRLPEPDGDLFSVVELHPTDIPKEQQLASLIRSSLV